MFRITHAAAALALGAGALALVRDTPSPAAPSPDVAGRVTAVADLREARASHTSTLLADGRVLIAGGFAGSGAEGRPYASTELYDPATRAFAAGPTLHAGRSGHTATLLGSGAVLVAGGWTSSPDARGTAELVDRSGRRAAPTGAMVVPRAGQTATRLRDGRVLLAGGVDRDDRPLASAELYDPATGRFARTGDMQVPRDAHTATLLADGRVLVVGGGGEGRYPSQTIQGSAELYDPATGRFAPAGSLGTPRHKHAAVALPDGRVLVIGGSDARDWRGRLASAELYDPARRAFRPAAGMRGPRFKLADAAALLPDGTVLVAGGGERTEVYAPGRDAFAPSSGTLGAARFYSTATVLRDGTALVTGGYADERNALPSSRRAFLYVSERAP